jgi:hypothetical protein
MSETLVKAAIRGFITMWARTPSMTRGGRLVSRRTLLAVLSAHLVLGFPAALRAQDLNACDLNSDKVVNVLDVQLIASMMLGLVPCTANIRGPGVCSPAVYQIVKDAALTGVCAPHSVSLNWTASTSANVKGYNVYRRAQADGPYTKLTSTPVAGTTFVDITVQAGQTYYYVATAVDSSNNESGYSNQASAVIPIP